MPQPLNPAVDALMANALRPRSAVPNSALCLAERARVFRARNDEPCQTNQGRGGFRTRLSDPSPGRTASARGQLRTGARNGRTCPMSPSAATVFVAELLTRVQPTDRA